MHRLKFIIICFFWIGCQNKTEPKYIEDYIKTADYDSSSLVGYKQDIMKYQKDNCSLFFRKIPYKFELIYEEFINPIGSQWKNNPNTIMLQSGLKNKEYEYEMYDPLNGYIYGKGFITNDTLIVMEIRTKNKDCEFYKMKDHLKLIR